MYLRRKSFVAVSLVLLLGIVLVFPLFSGGQQEGAEGGKQTVRVVGGFTQQIQSTDVEQPFFKELDQKMENLDIQFRTMDELGQGGFEAFRQLARGTYDIMEIQLGYVSGEDPFLQGVDLPGVASDVDEAREVVDAFKPLMDERLKEKFNGKILAIWPYGDQIFWLNDKLDKIEDLKGRKIRVFSSPMADFVQYFGAEGIAMGFSDVYQSLQRGVIDGAITGALAGNTASWYEVANYNFPLPVSYSIQLHMVNLDFWNGLDAETRKTLEKEFKGMEDELWDLAAEVTQEGYNCNTGQGECVRGSKGDMELLEVSDEDIRKAKEAVEKVILPSWAKNLTDEELEQWNNTAGKAAGVKITR